LRFLLSHPSLEKSEGWGTLDSERMKMINWVGHPPPGDKYFGVDVSKLPSGSAVLDNNPAGHVTVNAPSQAIKDAVVIKDKLTT
jgi:hypothetical protein